MQVMDQELILLELDAEDRDAALQKMIDRLEQAGRLNDKEGYKKAVYEREKEFSTAFEGGVAIPHGKTACAKCSSVAFARLKHPIQWDEENTEPVRMIFLLAIPQEEQGNDHLRILSALATNIMEEEFVEKLMQAENTQQACELLQAVV